jgi:aldose 1-epimerase
MNPAPAAYSATRAVVDGVETIRLADSARCAEVAIAPAIGNMAYEMTVHGRNILWFPYASPAELERHPVLCGVPFLGPWANRIDRDGYRANGREYLLNPELGNLRRDGNGKAIHGLLNFSPLWEVVDVAADETSAQVASRLEFWRHPTLMAQFPFAHTVTMTYRLAGGVLEVETAIENLSTEVLPVAAGYHPYFRLPNAPRDEWQVHIAATERMLLNEQLIPTGETVANPFGDPHHLRTRQLDDVFAGLVRDGDGRARFWVEAAGERVTVTYGPKYPVAVVYAPADKDFICFEPMAAPTNAFNLGMQQSVAPGEVWRESYWIEAGGF